MKNNGTASDVGKNLAATLTSWRFTEWSREDAGDIDGEVDRPSQRELASQTPYSIRIPDLFLFSCLLDSFSS
jgi:hypothetical protein